MTGGIARVVHGLGRLLPEGRALPESVWRRRHRLVLVLLWGHAAGIALFGLIRGYGLGHSALEGGVVAFAAAAGSFPNAPRKVRAAIGSLGLLTSSAILVHLSRGTIEFHFHFFVMVGLMALYQDWIPFLLAIGYVVVHHGTVGVLSPASVYNHPAAWDHPWRWAGIHGAFITAASLVSLIAWRLNEDAQARTERILTSAGQGIYGLDLQGRATFVNPAAARMLGHEIDELLGRRMHDVLHHSRPDGSPYPEDACPIYRALRDGAVRRVAEEVFWRRNGTSFPVEYVSTPIIDRGRVTGAVVAFEDITERQQAREEILRLNAHLERRVFERTAALQVQEQEARAAREEAERASRAKSEFLSRMSHELRTPLNAILGFGQLLEMDALTADQREGVAHILKGGEHLLALINEVLDIARIEAGRLQISLGSVRMREVVEECLRLVGPMAADLKVELNGRLLQRDDPVVVADRQRLAQVLLNLLSNAVKYNRPGGAVSVSWKPLNAGRLRVSVADTGCGIPGEQMARLFRPFERLEREGGRATDGAGIGLAISKGLVELMGGAIGVESAPGVGSTFWVDLPLAHPGRERASESTTPSPRGVGRVR